MLPCVCSLTESLFVLSKGYNNLDVHQLRPKHIMIHMTEQNAAINKYIFLPKMKANRPSGLLKPAVCFLVRNPFKINACVSPSCNRKK